MARSTDADITIIIKTFNRPQTVRKSVRSFRRRFPRTPILVADDSRAPVRLDDATSVIPLPYDSGVSFGRNRLVDHVDTEFLFLSDDDVVATRSTRLAEMKSLLERHDFDILGCRIEEPLRSRRRFFKRNFGRKLLEYETNMELTDGTLRWLEGFHEIGDGYVVCDVVHNVFLARAESVRAIGGWDDDLKTAEHLEFFLRAKRHGLRVGFTDRSLALHAPIMTERRSPAYKPFRTRTPEFRRLWMEKDGIEHVVRQNGAVMSAEEYVDISIW